MGKMGEGGIWGRLAVFSALSPFSLGVQGVVSIRGGSPEAATAPRAATGWDQPFWGCPPKPPQNGGARRATHLRITPVRPPATAGYPGGVLETQGAQHHVQGW